MNGFIAVKELISRNVASIEQMAFLDTVLENRQMICVAGPNNARKPVMLAVEELAAQYGELYHVKTVGVLQGIPYDDTPFKSTDCIVANLDFPDHAYTNAFLDLVSTGGIRGLAEISANSIDDAVHRLEIERNVKRYVIPSVIKAFVLAAKFPGMNDVRLISITEPLKLDDATGDIVTNAVFEWSPKKDEFEFNPYGNSRVLEVMAKIAVKRKEEMLEELRRREDKFR